MRQAEAAATLTASMLAFALDTGTRKWLSHQHQKTSASCQQVIVNCGINTPLAAVTLYQRIAHGR
jgi:PIN domain nuclease of toxin-antitoxin system